MLPAANAPDAVKAAENGWSSVVWRFVIVIGALCLSMACVCLAFGIATLAFPID